MTVSDDLQAELIVRLRAAGPAMVRQGALIAWCHGVRRADIQLLTGLSPDWVNIVVAPDMTEAERAARATALAQIEAADHAACAADARRLTDGALAGVSGAGKIGRLIRDLRLLGYRPNLIEAVLGMTQSQIASAWKRSATPEIRARAETAQDQRERRLQAARLAPVWPLLQDLLARWVTSETGARRRGAAARNADIPFVPAWRGPRDLRRGWVEAVHALRDRIAPGYAAQVAPLYAGAHCDLLARQAEVLALHDALPPQSRAHARRLIVAEGVPAFWLSEQVMCAHARGQDKGRPGNASPTMTQLRADQIAALRDRVEAMLTPAMLAEAPLADRAWAVAAVLLCEGLSAPDVATASGCPSRSLAWLRRALQLPEMTARAERLWAAELSGRYDVSIAILQRVGGEHRPHWRSIEARRQAEEAQAVPIEVPIEVPIAVPRQMLGPPRAPVDPLAEIASPRWSPQEDLLMMQARASGLPLDAIARDLRRPCVAVTARWHRLRVLPEIDVALRAAVDSGRVSYGAPA